MAVFSCGIRRTPVSSLSGLEILHIGTADVGSVLALVQ